MEAQLALTVKYANGWAYNRTQYMKHHTAMMQVWADYLDKLAAGGDVVRLRTWRHPAGLQYSVQRLTVSTHVKVGRFHARQPACQAVH